MIWFWFGFSVDNPNCTAKLNNSPDVNVSFMQIQSVICQDSHLVVTFITSVNKGENWSIVVFLNK